MPSPHSSEEIAQSRVEPRVSVDSSSSSSTSSTTTSSDASADEPAPRLPEPARGGDGDGVVLRLFRVVGGGGGEHETLELGAFAGFSLRLNPRAHHEISLRGDVQSTSRLFPVFANQHLERDDAAGSRARPHLRDARAGPGHPGRTDARVPARDASGGRAGAGCGARRVYVIRRRAEKFRHLALEIRHVLARRPRRRASHALLGLVHATTRPSIPRPNPEASSESKPEDAEASSESDFDE